MLEHGNVALGVIALFENISVILDHPSASFALLGVLLMIFFMIHLRRVKLNTPTIINVALMLALTVILHQLRLYHMPQGGSVTFGGMIPLLMIAFRYGASVGALAGFVFGLINMIQDPFILHPIQVLFDYPLPFMAMGLAGLLHEKMFMGVILAFVGRFMCHFISGVVFFAEYAPEGMSPMIYSITANATYLVPELIISCILLKVLPMKRLLAAMDRSVD